MLALLLLATPIELQLHVAAEAPIDDWVAVAARYFAPAEVELHVTKVDAPAVPRVATRAARDAGEGPRHPHLRRRSPRQPLRREVARLHHRQRRGARAHELGHFFGLPHSIMNNDADEQPGFAAEEFAYLKRAASNPR